MEKKHALGLHLHGATSGWGHKISGLGKYVTATLLTLLLLSGSAGVWGAQQTSQSRPVVAEKMDTGFRIGPYPVPFQYEGVSTIFWTWIYLNPVIEGRGNPMYKLFLTIKVQIDNIPEVTRVIAERTLNQNNCGRINAVDNWVYSVKRPALEVRNANTLRVILDGHISTWSCLENPIPETVCDTYRDSLGLQWPYNCKFRPTTPIKWINFEVGIIATEDLSLSTTKDGQIQYKVNQPLVRLDNSGFFNPVINLLIDFFYNMGAATSNALLVPSKLPLTISRNFLMFNPRFEDARFETSNSSNYISITASASVTTAQINTFMRNAIGKLWTDIASRVGITPAPGPMTKSRLRAECQQTLPAVDIRECAARMGWPYDALPD